MRILLLTHHQPFDAEDGSNLRIRALASELAKHSQVEILSLISPRKTPRAPRVQNGIQLTETRNWFQFVEFFSRAFFPPYVATAALNCWNFCPTHPPYDVIISETPWLWPFARRFRGKLKILSAHNVELEWNQPYVEGRITPRTATRLIKALEQKAYRECDGLIAVTSEDVAKFTALFGKRKNVVVIPNGFQPTPPSTIDTNNLRTELGIPPHHRIGVFVGSSVLHNTLAIEAFSKSVTRRDLNHWTFIVLGRVCNSLNIHDSRFRLMGFQQNLKPFYAIAHISLNPMEWGSGSNTKVLEALGNSVPVLTTPFGRRGILDTPGLYESSLNNFVAVLERTARFQPPDPANLEPYTWQNLGTGYHRALTEMMRNS